MPISSKEYKQCQIDNFNYKQIQYIVLLTVIFREYDTRYVSRES